MENQHRLIKGYRDLTAEDIALMNFIKEFGAKCEALIDSTYARISAQYEATKPTYAVQKDGDFESAIIDSDAETAAKHAEVERLKAAEPFRWIAIAKTDLQQALMALTRAVAQPGSF